MIRPATRDDAAAAAAVTVAAGMFTEDEAGFLPGLFHDFLADARDGAHGLVVDAEDVEDAEDVDRGDGSAPVARRVVGVAYWRPVEAADRVVDLTMLAVHPDVQGTGRGKALVRHAEDRARAAGQRLLLVQTSGTEQYRGSRRFYAGLGYEQVATVRDYWADGDDLVLFRKTL